MNQIISIIGTAFFLPFFIFLLVFADLLQRIFGFSRTAFVFIYNLVNSSVIESLVVFCGLKIEVEYEEGFDYSFDPNLKKLIIANHQSLIDIPFVAHVLPKLCLRYISKRELAKNLPYVSYSLRKMPHCLIDRGNRAQAVKNISNYVSNSLKNDEALVLFPEGTRARDGELKAFKPGGFSAAISSSKRSQVYTVAIDGSYRISKNKLLPVPYGLKVRIKVFNPVLVNQGQDLLKVLASAHEKISNFIDINAE